MAAMSRRGRGVANSDGAPNPRREWTFGIQVRDLDSTGNQESVRDHDDDRDLDGDPDVDLVRVKLMVDTDIMVRLD